MSQKIFDYDLVAIRKTKVILTLHKPAYIGMCTLELSKVLMYEFNYDYIRIKYGKKSRVLCIGNDGLMYETKTEDVYADFSYANKLSDFSNSSTKSNYYDNSNKLVVVKLKNEATRVVIEEFVGLKPKICSYFGK